MTVRMWPVLPKDHPANGLSQIEQALIDDPEQTHVVIAVLNARRITIDADTSENVPTARIVHIEPVSGQAQIKARELLAAACRTRTGSETLPFESQDDDSGTGE